MNRRIPKISFSLLDNKGWIVSGVGGQSSGPGWRVYLTHFHQHKDHWQLQFNQYVLNIQMFWSIINIHPTCVILGVAFDIKYFWFYWLNNNDFTTCRLWCYNSPPTLRDTLRRVARQLVNWTTNTSSLSQSKTGNYKMKNEEWVSFYRKLFLATNTCFVTQL